MKTIKERLSEPSTWRGIMMLLTAFGVTISPELQEYIISGGLALVGIIGMVTKDKV